MIVKQTSVFCAAIIILSLLGCERQRDPIVIIQDAPSVEAFVSSFVEGENIVKEEEFVKIVEAATGYQILPIDPEYEIDTIIMDELKGVLNQAIKKFNAADGTIKDRQLESTLIELLNGCPGFKCDFARNAKGNIQRTGYPNLRWRDEESGRVVYIAPRIIKVGNQDSSLQSFNYTPSRSVGKIHDDGNHLLISLEHKNWQFSNWYIVDLYRFKVRMRIEFEANNKEVYIPEYIISDSNQ